VWVNHTAEICGRFACASSIAIEEPSIAVLRFGHCMLAELCACDWSVGRGSRTCVITRASAPIPHTVHASCWPPHIAVIMIAVSAWIADLSNSPFIASCNQTTFAGLVGSGDRRGSRLDSNKHADRACSLWVTSTLCTDHLYLVVAATLIWDARSKSPRHSFPASRRP